MKEQFIYQKMVKDPEDGTAIWKECTESVFDNWMNYSGILAVRRLSIDIETKGDLYNQHLEDLVYGACRGYFIPALGRMMKNNDYTKDDILNMLRNMEWDEVLSGL